MAYEKVLSTFTQINGGVLGFGECFVIVLNVFFNQFETVFHLDFGTPQEILTDYSGLLLGEWFGFTELFAHFII